MHVSLSLSTSLSLYLSIYPSIHLSIYLYIYLSIYLSIYIYIYIYPYIYLSISIYIYHRLSSIRLYLHFGNCAGEAKEDFHLILWYCVLNNLHTVLLLCMHIDVIHIFYLVYALNKIILRNTVKYVNSVVTILLHGVPQQTPQWKWGYNLWRTSIILIIVTVLVIFLMSWHFMHLHLYIYACTFIYHSVIPIFHKSSKVSDQMSVHIYSQDIVV